MSIKRVTFASILALIILIVIGIGIGIAGAKFEVANQHFKFTPSFHMAELRVPGLHTMHSHEHFQLHASHVEQHVVSSHMSRLDVHVLS